MARSSRLKRHLRENGQSCPMNGALILMDLYTEMAAVMASPSRKDALRTLTVPTLVLHGDADPLLPLEYGIDTANAIPGAKLRIIEGMGHTLPEALWPLVIDAIAGHAL